MGEPADNFVEATYAGTIRPLDPKMKFYEACSKLPTLKSTVIAMATINVKPWGIQVAGNFRRNAAIRQWQRLQGRYRALLADYEPVVSRVRSPLGRSGIYAVQDRRRQPRQRQHHLPAIARRRRRLHRGEEPLRPVTGFRPGA